LQAQQAKEESEREVNILKLSMIMLVLSMLACTTTQKDPDVLTWKTTCAPFSSAQDFPEYCLHETGGKLQKTLLYLHGLADSAHAMLVSPYPKDRLIAFAKEMGYSHVLVPSFGKNWMLRPAVTGRKSVDEFIGLLSAVEAKHKVPSIYHAVGISMGSANLAILCMTQSALFEKCVLLNPMLVRDEEYNIGWSFLPGFIINDHYTRSEWTKSNPFTLLTNADKMTPSWITACPDDGFKLYDNTHNWVGNAIVKGFDVTWKPASEGCKHSSPMMDGLAEWMRK
jgi:pimeloyl-ACP methyl ester carboxylesterase